MRIIAGLAKGRVLRSLRGRALRPTADRVREAVFASLGDLTPAARFLDLYAGAGTMGLEALSRGAAEATFVESHGPARRVIWENARRCGFQELVRIIDAPVASGLARLRRQGAVFDLIFVDPPYETSELGSTMARLAQWPGMVAEGGLIICQHSRHQELSGEAGPFRRMKRSRYGETIVDFYQRGGQAGDGGSLCGNL
jgi:16S rRNA (guanine966-N2)-methyltransferase